MGFVGSNKSKAEARRIQQAGADAVAKGDVDWAKANRWAIEGALKEAGSLPGSPVAERAQCTDPVRWALVREQRKECRRPLGLL